MLLTQEPPASTPTRPPGLPVWAGPAVVARLIGLSRAGIYNLLAAGELGARKAGGRTLINVDEALAWVASRPAATFRVG